MENKHMNKVELNIHFELIRLTELMKSAVTLYTQTDLMKKIGHDDFGFYNLLRYLEDGLNKLTDTADN
mgnify:CR=1 FL=1